MTRNIRSRSNARAAYDDQKVDLFNKLPDEALSLIISKLPVDEAIRTSILSKRWRSTWRFTPHLEIHGKRMIMPLAQKENPNNPYLNLSNALNQGLKRYGLNISIILIRHSGDLHSCKLVHFPYSVACEEVICWVRLAKVKKVKCLSLDCEPFDIGTLQSALHRLEDSERRSKPNFPRGIFSGLLSLEFAGYSLSSSEPFLGCENLKTLILKAAFVEDETLEGILENCKGLENLSLVESFGFRKLQILSPNLKVLLLNALKPDEIVIFAEGLEVLILDSLLHPETSLLIHSPNLRVLHYFNNSMLASTFASMSGTKILRASELLGNYHHFWDSRSDVFQSLSKISIDMDLNDVQECRLISTFLRQCAHLETLEITLPIHNDMINRGFFWDFQSACNCVRDQLKYVYIRGFKGNSQEFEFLKHIITMGRKLVRVTILCSRFIEEEERLWTLASASPDLSVIIKFKIHSAEQELYDLQYRELKNYK